MISRRQFVVEVASLAALASCQSDQRGGAQDTQGGRPRAGLPNPDSRLGTGLHHATPASSATPGAATPNVPFHTFDATLAPRLKSPVKIHFTARETRVRLKADVAGEFVFVNRAFSHGQKGAIGQLIVEA